MASAVGGLWWRSIRPVPVRDRGIVGHGLLATGALSTAIDERLRLPGCLFRRHVIGLASAGPAAETRSPARQAWQQLSRSRSSRACGGGRSSRLRSPKETRIAATTQDAA